MNMLHFFETFISKKSKKKIEKVKNIDQLNKFIKESNQNLPSFTKNYLSKTVKAAKINGKGKSQQRNIKFTLNSILNIDPSNNKIKNEKHIQDVLNFVSNPSNLFLHMKFSEKSTPTITDSIDKKFQNNQSFSNNTTLFSNNNNNLSSNNNNFSNNNNNLSNNNLSDNNNLSNDNKLSGTLEDELENEGQLVSPRNNFEDNSDQKVIPKISFNSVFDKIDKKFQRWKVEKIDTTFRKYKFFTEEDRTNVIKNIFTTSYNLDLFSSFQHHFQVSENSKQTKIWKFCSDCILVLKQLNIQSEINLGRVESISLINPSQFSLKLKVSAFIFYFFH